jgi:hypothetical protein
MTVGAGKAAITGAVLSTTVMVCELVEELSQLSVAVHVLVTLYSPAQSPAVVTSLNVIVNKLPHSSTAAATANTGVAGQLIVVGPGNALKIGAVRSCTLMVSELVEVFPQASVAVQVRVTMYSTGQSPGIVTSL